MIIRMQSESTHFYISIRKGTEKSPTGNDTLPFWPQKTTSYPVHYSGLCGQSGGLYHEFLV